MTEQRRVAAKREKDEKMQAMLDRMGDAINPHRERELQMKLDQDYIASCIADDQKAHRQIQLEKIKARRQHLDLQRDLDR